MKLSPALLAWSLLLGLALWYLYWVTAGEAPTAQETTLLVGVAVALVIGTAMLRARLRRAKEGKRP